MVVVDRIDFCISQVRAGRYIVINYLPSPTNGKLKVKLLNKPTFHYIPEHISMTLISSLEMLKSLDVATTTVDRGHKHTDGTMEVSIWFAAKSQVQACTGAQNKSGTPSEADKKKQG